MMKQPSHHPHLPAPFRRAACLLLCCLLAAGCWAAPAFALEDASGGENVSQAEEAPQTEAAPAESAAGEETTGSKTITLTVVHGDGTSNDITVSTDAENLRDALEAEGIIAGEDSSYGMFVQTVDGETADDGEQEWWCLTKGGEMWNYGVDDTEIADGDVYEFTLTVGY